jgi:hypothetical protein
LGAFCLFQLTMCLSATVALAACLVLPRISAASIPEDALQALGGKAKPVERREEGPSPPSRLLDIEGKAQYFASTSAWWLSHLTSDADLDIAMSEIAKVRQQLLGVC